MLEQTQPQAQDSAPPPEAPAEEGATSDVNWADFAEDSDDDAGLTVEGEFQVDEGGEPAQVADEPTPAAPAQAPTAEPTAQPQTPAAPAEPVAPVQPQTSQTSAPEPQPAQAPQPALDYNSWRTQQVSNLEKHYALDSDTALALQTEPETVLPRLAAQVHLEVTENVLRAVQQMVPGLIQQVNQSTAVETKAQNAFFDRNPDLKGVDQAKILQIGAMFRQVNPGADADTAIATIGSMVRTALGMPAGSATAQGAAPSAPPAPVMQPFTPARGSGGTAPRAPAQGNPWADLIDSDD
jgi:hypothetical protein